jgi:hypothetical protein
MLLQQPRQFALRVALLVFRRVSAGPSRTDRTKAAGLVPLCHGRADVEMLPRQRPIWVIYFLAVRHAAAIVAH